MKVNTFAKLAIGVGVVALSVAGVVPAHAASSRARHAENGAAPVTRRAP